MDLSTKMKIKIIVGILVSMSVMFFGIWISYDWKYLKADMVFINNYGGGMTHIKTSGGNVVVDMGGSGTGDIGEKLYLPYFLEKGNGKIKVLVLTDGNLEHISGLKSVLKGVNIDKIVILKEYEDMGEKICELSNFPISKMFFLNDGEVVSVGNMKIHREIKGKRGEGKVDTNSRIRLMADYKGMRFILESDTIKGLKALGFTDELLSNLPEKGAILVDIRKKHCKIL